MTPGAPLDAAHASPRATGSADPRATEAFRALLDDVRRRVDADLEAWLRPRVAKAKAVSAEAGAAAEAVQGLTLRGGKRMRAALVHAGFVACGSAAGATHDPEAALPTMPAMLAVELLQTYLLIHDDWMDDDDVRRGGPSVHVALGERLGGKRLGDAAAVLAGDLACGYAQDALLESKLPADRVLGAARAFARIQEDVVTGQLAEMASAGAAGRSAAPSVETIHELKTASYTVTGPLALGAHLAGASESRIAELARYGRPLGIAFQLRDDLLGTFGDPSATGKPVGNDIRQGKRTALVVELRGDAKAEALLARVLGRDDASDDDVAEVVRAMESTGAKARVEARVAELLGEARAALEAMGLNDDAPASLWLSGAVRALGERAS
ncbi:MAG: polyprenyl synthetase family protein [Deltaproteobacteria bacterium]|nr:polyprenyl synthetase family protein [Deltaproteobacteria bacterium]